MKEYQLIADNEQSMIALGRNLAAALQAPLVLGFTGELGSGKTTLIRAMLRALGIEGAVKSPTYSLVESYDCQRIILHHFDLYRLISEEELEMMGFRDFFNATSVCCVEWPEKLSISEQALDVHLTIEYWETGRRLKLMARTDLGEQFLKQVST